MKRTANMLIVQLFFCMLFCYPADLISQDMASNSIKKRQKELEKLNKSITDTRRKINTLSKKERSAIKDLHTNQKHSLDLNKYLNLLDDQINDLQQEINMHDSVYYGLSYKLRQMITEYAALARQTYLEGNTSDAEVLLTDKSFDSDIKRDIYMEKLTEMFKQNMQKINIMRVAVSNEAGVLKDQSDYQAELKEIKTREKQFLTYTISKNKRLLTKIKSDANLLKKQLKQKEQSAGKIKSIIADLIRKETSKPDNKAIKGLPIGKITWPVDSRVIFRGYGNQKNKETDTYFENPGIDIKASSGTSVKTVADGEVSMVHWLPGYGTLVILNHGNGMRTVYANLSTVYVKKGEKVTKGSSIGKTGESVDGEFLHFELWQGSKRLNPSKYLN